VEGYPFISVLEGGKMFVSDVEAHTCIKPNMGIHWIN